MQNFLFELSQGVGIGTPNPDVSAALDVTANNKGLLIPRMNFASIVAIANPARGLMVYDSLANQLMVNIGVPTAPNWQPIVGSTSEWRLTSNKEVNPANQFIGTTDNQPLRFRLSAGKWPLSSASWNNRLSKKVTLMFKRHEPTKSRVIHSSLYFINMQKEFIAQYHMLRLCNYLRGGSRKS